MTYDEFIILVWIPLGAYAKQVLRDADFVGEVEAKDETQNSGHDSNVAV